MNQHDRTHFEVLFRHYPDVVTLQQFCEMLGGIADCTARKLMQGAYVEHFVIKGTYYIPKDYVIDYVLSEHYAEYDKQLKHHITIGKEAISHETV